MVHSAKCLQTIQNHQYQNKNRPYQSHSHSHHKT
ncbi:hypothetical protein FWK35_00005260 [Aphis craccivora]|uniref:Uncharacterized protein n=1 Tax=Aphis craccivora TaxID=307492 RepID=A0A6G0ZP74_APHCR|nr:hypothetical protein FWK35_00005260 [Aphis craccivora]